MKIVRTIISIGLIASLSGCGIGQRWLNPFYEEPGPTAYLGSPNDHALDEGHEKMGSARAAFDAAGNYQRANDPAPENPVMKPSVVRLMWIPDHLNNAGDLVPAHYYYVKVKKEDWAVTDAFELQGQLNNGKGEQDASAVPYQFDKDSH